MGLFKNQTRRESVDFRWPFKPVDESSQPKPRQLPSADGRRSLKSSDGEKRRNRKSLKISNPILIESTKDLREVPEVPNTAPLVQARSPMRLSGFNEKPQHFEPLFHDDYVSPAEEKLPFELSAASASRFHDYLQDLSSTDPSADNSEYEADDYEMPAYYQEQVAMTVSLASPGKPKIIDLSSASSFGSSRSANSSVSDVRVSGFLHSRTNSEMSTEMSSCSTPFTPASFFDTSEETTPEEELDEELHEAKYNAELLKMNTQSSLETQDSLPSSWEPEAYIPR